MKSGGTMKDKLDRLERSIREDGKTVEEIIQENGGYIEETTDEAGRVTRIRIHPGRAVICDSCGANWTDRTEEGGLLVLSKAVCPDCTPGYLEDLAKYNEEWAIRGRCPKGMAFADWVRAMPR